ncbi:FHA domain-containing protein [Roseimaritima ulvae]|uniref:FHA domain protein n=1 Tax=Roseimaritima ulvae TaxID=980254 RepID=A0A5B9QKT3_9BACT|nr:FHA domain-containing protein [Roseimaritima ulvae]QEG38599.1 FHA domain protein [Roseimaritima ulvae]
MYYGIDFGSEMLKVASTNDIGDQQVLIQLSQTDPFLPTAISLFQQQNSPQPGVAVGWDVYDQRAMNRSIASSFRDDIDDEAKRLVHNRQLILAEFFQAILSTLQLTNDFAMSIPDDWGHANWTLGTVFRNGVRPAMFVREWQTICCTNAELCGDVSIFASLGSGPARLTLCQLKEQCWTPLKSVRLNSISGAKLKKRIIDWVAEEMISEFRLDPREHLEAYCQIVNSVDRAFIQLAHSGTATIDATVLGRRLQRNLDGVVMMEMAADMATSLRGALESLVKNIQSDTIDVVLWGELTLILPIADWCLPFCRGGTQPIHCSLDSVAAGTARLCAATTESNCLDNADLYEAIDTETGAYWTALLEVSESMDVIPVLRDLPVSLAAGRVPTPAAITIVETNEKRVVGAQLLIGRSPKAEWSFPSDKYPELSFEHCVLLKRKSEYFLKDLNSTNGTFVNGERISIHRIQNGDQFQLGESGPTFRFASQ